jgi:hypothetical protein
MKLQINNFTYNSDSELYKFLIIEENELFVGEEFDGGTDIYGKITNLKINTILIFDKR